MSGPVNRLTLVASLVLASGCFQISTSEVQVRDANRVEVRSSKGDAVLGAEQSDGLLASGKYWDMLDRVPYEVRARRDPEGAVVLHCEACGRVDWPYSGHDDVTLLEHGRTLPTLTWNVAIERTGVVADYQVCMVDTPKHCDLTVPARLFAPMSDVVEVRRRTEPVRAWGYILLTVSALWVGAATVYTLSAGSRPGDRLSDRWPWGLTAAVPGLALGAMGLWEVLTPAKEQVWQPE